MGNFKIKKKFKNKKKRKGNIKMKNAIINLIN